MHLKFNRNLQLGYGFSIFVLLLIGIFSYRTVSDLLVSNLSVEHSNEVIQKLEYAISISKDAETGQRGYLLTNQTSFLEPYNGALEKAEAVVDQVSVLTADNPQQQQNMVVIKHIMARRLGIIKALIDKRQQGKAVTTADLEGGKGAMDVLRHEVDRAEADERRLLEARISVLDHYTTLTPVVIIIAILIALVITVLSYLKVIRDVNEKDRLTHELEIKEEETAAFNEELTAANEEIVATNEELLAAQDKLAMLNQSLEEKVDQRTKALSESESKAQALNEELTATNEELAAANEEMVATNEDLAQNRLTLEKSEKLFKSIAVNIPKSLIIVIGPDQRFLAVEGDLMAKMGYDGQSYVGKHPSEVSTAERYAESRELYERVLAGEQFTVERKGVMGDDFRVDFVPLKSDEGEVFAGLIIALDITDLKKAEEKSAKLAAIVESSDDAIISKTLGGIITSWNSAAERMFGYKEGEMVGQSILKLIPEDRQEEEPLIIARLKMGERVDHFETKRVTNQKQILDVSLTISPIRDSHGTITGVSKIARDISEKKQDELRKNDFIGMVSHELKTPLTSLTALIQVLGLKLQGNGDNFIPTALGKANVQVKKMSTIISGFLDISRLESGKIMINKQPFDLVKLIREVLEETELTVSSHQILMEPGESVIVEADRDKIGSVISNLVSNAVKYSPKGKTITVKCDLDGQLARVSVRDEGIGINPEDQDKLFERYYRVNTNHTQHISGFGIGLYLSAEIIQRHEGRIWVESLPGVGSTFYFTLPLG